MNQELGPLLVEIFLERAHILGICRQVQERRRLIDVLNHQDDTMEIEQARVSLGPNSEPKHYETLSLLKSSILAAVPRETHEQNRRRAVLTNMMGKQETRQKSISLIVPPMALDGAAHISAGAGGALSVKMFTKFFPLTRNDVDPGPTGPSARRRTGQPRPHHRDERGGRAPHGERASTYKPQQTRRRRARCRARLFMSSFVSMSWSWYPPSHRLRCRPPHDL